MSENRLWRMVAGKKTGPYEPAKLRPLVKDDRIGPLDRFSYDGATWKPAEQFPELFQAPSKPVVAIVPTKKVSPNSPRERVGDVQTDGLRLSDPEGSEPSSDSDGFLGDSQLAGEYFATSGVEDDREAQAFVKLIRLLIFTGVGLVSLLFIMMAWTSLATKGPAASTSTKTSPPIPQPLVKAPVDPFVSPAAAEKPAVDKPPADKVAGDKVAGDKVAGDKAAAEKAAAEKAAADKFAAEKVAAEKAAGDKAPGDKAPAESPFRDTEPLRP